MEPHNFVTRDEFHAAFPLNSIGKPDVDGHRVSHEDQKVTAQNLAAYKTKVIEKILLGGVTAILTIFGFGFGPHFESVMAQVKNILGL